MEPCVSKINYYLVIDGGVVAAILLGVLVGLGADAGISGEAVMVIGVLALSGALLGIVAAWLRLLHTAWKAIQDDSTPITPGKAVGFFFIPFYNLYWVFRVVKDYPKEYNDFCDRNSIDAPVLAGGEFTAIPVLVALSVIPVVGCATTLVLLVLLQLYIPKVCNAVNALPRTEVEA